MSQKKHHAIVALGEACVQCFAARQRREAASPSKHCHYKGDYAQISDPYQALNLRVMLLEIDEAPQQRLYLCAILSEGLNLQSGENLAQAYEASLQT